MVVIVLRDKKRMVDQAELLVESRVTSGSSKDGGVRFRHRLDKLTASRAEPG